METKDGLLLFLALLSILLFGCQTFSALRNASEIAELKTQLQNLSERQTHGKIINSNEHDVLVGLAKQVAEILYNKDSYVEKKYGPDHVSHRLRRSSSNQDQQRLANSESPTTGETLNLLTNALLNIVERQLNSKLDCSQADDTTQCTIKPGPKGDQGDRGRRGPVGERGDKGNLGDIGEKGDRGEKGQIGYPGYKGEKGQVGVVGPPGPSGLRGTPGLTGSIVRLQQTGCSWHYTDQCGHRCGYQVLKRATCPIGQYVAGFGMYTAHDLGRYNPHIWCCPVSTEPEVPHG